MIKICNLWSNERVKWNEGNWTWSECELVQEICETWNNAKWFWPVASWQWSECSSSLPPLPTTCSVWGTTNVFWKNASWKWSECTGSIPIPVVSIINQPGVDATMLIQPWMEEQPWNPYQTGSHDKRKRLIKLICKVQGKEYNEEKEIGDYKITVGDVRMTVKSVSNIDLDLKLEE